jgi:hypothetical protein
MKIIGNATVIILICYILTGLTTKRKISFSMLISNIIVLILLHLILLR